MTSMMRTMALALAGTLLIALGSTARAGGPGIQIESARIGCLDIQHAPNLTALVARKCDGQTSCPFKAPTPRQYRAAGVHARTRSFCTQAMEIKYKCGSGATRTVMVPGNAWKHPPARLECQATVQASPASATAHGSKVVLVSAPVLSQTSAMTRFDPKRDGFHFYNDFKNDLVPKGLSAMGIHINIHTKGLCGGMVYTALDYYNAHKPIPYITYRPATGTPLAAYIYKRETRSIETNVPEWGNMFDNVGGRRNVELFKRGLDGRSGGALARLMSYLNRGQPVVLDLKGTGKGSHQVLAIGYDLGGYRGDFGAHEDDLKIKIYNPNQPDKVDTLIPLPSQHVWETTLGQERWRGFFVDTKYRPKTPTVSYPVYARDGKVHELILVVATGNNDLRGGRANVNLEVDFADGSRQMYPNINHGARWLPNYTQNARVVLHSPVRKQDIRKLILTDTFRSGINHDTWRMQSLEAKGLENGELVPLGSAGAHFFTVAANRFEVALGP